MRNKNIKFFFISLVIGICVFNLMTPVIVHGDSMYPTYHSNNLLLMNRVYYMFEEPKRGDIIVFKSNIIGADGKVKYIIKRVIGIPGDNLEIKGGKVYLDDKIYKEAYLEKEYTDGYININIGKNKYFVMGDNRTVSLDSRSGAIGLVDYKTIIGKIYYRIL